MNRRNFLKTLSAGFAALSLGHFVQKEEHALNIETVRKAKELYEKPMVLGPGVWEVTGIISLGAGSTMCHTRIYHVIDKMELSQDTTMFKSIIGARPVPDMSIFNTMGSTKDVELV